MKSNASIYSRDAKLVYTERIFCFDDYGINIDVQLGDNKDDVLKLRFYFKNTNDGKVNILVKPGKNGLVAIDLINFNNPLGTGTKKPLPIAKLKDEFVYLLFNVNKPDEGCPILDISIYLGKNYVE